MLRPRVIPCLLVRNGGLVKTVRFADGKYVGDPINAVRIFNEKRVDELLIADIDATVKKVGPNYGLIRNVARECRMPLGYIGGIRSADEVEDIVCLGVEKVGISSAAVSNPNLITECARRVGNQSIVIVIDVKKVDNRGVFEVVTHNGTSATGRCPICWAAEAEERGAGEIVLNSVDRDGVMCGYDLDLIERVWQRVKIPVTALGGAGCVADIGKLFERCGVIGAAIGSLFVFKGKYRAVLISYLTAAERAAVTPNPAGQQG